MSQQAWALHDQAIALWQQGRRDEALRRFEAALTLAPDDAGLWNSLGAALQGLDRAEDALAAYDRALAHEPGHAGALFNRATVLHFLRRRPEALVSCEQVLAHAPDHAQAWCLRAALLAELGRADDALAGYGRAIALRPDYAEAWYKRGLLRWSLGQARDAIADLEAALRHDPHYPYARGDLLHLKLQCGDWRDWDRQAALLDAGVRAGAKVAQPFIYAALSSSPADLRHCARIFAADQYPAQAMTRPRQGAAGGKIRLGYVSGEFCEQATAYLMAGLYEHHDKSRFELIAFDNGRNDHGPTRQRLEAAFDAMVPVAGLSDRAAAAAVADRGIDILVNLNGYFGAQRMGVFAHRPAPLQVNYLGFPGTLGAPYIDYILADRIVLPDDERGFYDEQVVWLPGTYQAQDDRRAIAAAGPARAQCGLPQTGFVFCNFNQAYKILPPIFARWMALLRRVEGSVLWLLEGRGDFAARLRQEAGRQGVDPGRLIFAPAIPADRHLDRLALADLFLDTLPYNAHTTASDALWAGLPLLTCRGTAFPGRVAASLLQALGVPELVTDSLEDYDAMALRLAQDPALLRRLREKIGRSRAALFDTARFCRRLESAYRTMWDIHRRGGAPESFAVPE